MLEDDILLSQPVGAVRVVTAHAIDRWMERTQTRSKARAIAKLQKLLAKAEEVELAPQFRAKALLNHNLEPARYLRFDTWIFVVSMAGVLKTVHAGGAKRWGLPAEKPVRERPRKRRSR